MAARPLPPQARREAPPGGRLERWSWYFFRWSGLALVFLALGHLLIMHVINTVDQLDYQFVVERWRSWGWRLWDWLLLALALTHGANGLRLAIDDSLHRPLARDLARWTAGLAYAVLMLLGTATIVSFRG